MKQNNTRNNNRKKTSVPYRYPWKINEKTVKEITKSTIQTENDNPEIKPFQIHLHRCVSQKIIKKENTKIVEKNGIFQGKKNSQKTLHIKYQEKNNNKKVKNLKSKTDLMANDKTHHKKNSSVIINKEIKSKILKNDNKNVSKKETKIKSEDITKKFVGRYFPFQQKKRIIGIYGQDIFKDLIKNEKKYLISKNYLCRHTLRPSLRKKIVDWMIDIFSAYESDSSTFEMSVRLMDGYLNLTKRTINDDDLLLIGFCCIYLASKIEDIIPIDIISFQHLGCDCFSIETIKKEEIEIVNTLNFDFYPITCRDFVYLLLNDFEIYNIKDVKKMIDGRKFYYKFKIFCIFLCKILLYSEELVTYRPSLLCTGIFGVAYDLARLKIGECDKVIKRYIHDWIFSVFASLKFENSAIKHVYLNLYSLYKKIISDSQEKSPKKKKSKKKKSTKKKIEKDKKEENDKNEENKKKDENINSPEK